MSLMQKCLLFPMVVGLKSKIFALNADNFTVEVLLQNLWTTLYAIFARELYECMFHTHCTHIAMFWLESENSSDGLGNVTGMDLRKYKIQYTKIRSDSEPC